MSAEHSPEKNLPNPARGLRPTGAEIGALLLLAFAAADLRVWAGRGELWFDEINVLSMIDLFIHRPADILFNAPFDNNHLLLTWWMYVSGLGQAALWYRLPAILAGTGSVVVAWFLGRRSGRAAAWVSAVAVAGSYALVNFDSEARGYSLAVLCLLLAWLMLTGGIGAARGPGLRVPVFWLVCIVGVLANLLFAVYFLMLAVWAAWLGGPGKWGWRRGTAGTVAVWFGLPIVFMTALFFVFIIHIKPLGGGAFPLSRSLATVAALLVGGPPTGWGLMVGAGVGVVLLALALRAEWRRNADSGRLLVLLTVVATAAVIAINPIGVLYPRDFLLSFVPALLALAAWVGRWLEARDGRRAAATVLAAAFIALNTLGIHGLLTLGRGHHVEALADIVRQTPHSQITLAGNHDLEIQVLLQRSQLPPEAAARITYYTISNLPASGAEWYIVTTDDPADTAAPTVKDPRGNVYDLDKDWNYMGLSGSRWEVYRRRP